MIENIGLSYDFNNEYKSRITEAELLQVLSDDFFKTPNRLLDELDILRTSNWKSMLVRNSFWFEPRKYIEFLLFKLVKSKKVELLKVLDLSSIDSSVPISFWNTLLESSEIKFRWEINVYRLVK